MGRVELDKRVFFHLTYQDWVEKKKKKPIIGVQPNPHGSDWIGSKGLTVFFFFFILKDEHWDKFIRLLTQIITDLLIKLYHNTKSTQITQCLFSYKLVH